jgi:hypothetical protein
MAAPLNHTHKENNLEEFFRRRVMLLGGYAEKITGMSRGCPDRLVLMPGGRMYLVELKAETGSVEPLQVMWHARANNLGTKVYVVTGREGVIKWLRAMVGSTDTKRRGGPRPKPASVDLSDKAV